MKAREEVSAQLEALLATHGEWDLRITPSEIFLGEEPVVRPRARAGKDVPTRGAEEQLPFVFYRDGIRCIRIRAGIPRHEIEALFDAIAECGFGSTTHDDLPSLLWQANLTGIEFDLVPLEQPIYLAPGSDGPGGQGGVAGPAYVQVAGGAEKRSEVGPAPGARGLHHDFDDWDLPDSTVDVPTAFALLSRTDAVQNERLRSEWEREAARGWADSVNEFMRLILSFDASLDTRQALAHATTSWLEHALQRGRWMEASGAMALLAELEPDATRREQELRALADRVDPHDLAELLDEAEGDEHGAFAAMSVALGQAGVAMTFDILTHSKKTRTQAAAATALCYLCADEPEALAPRLADTRAQVVLQLAFVLGQIGGPNVAGMLQLLAQHPDPRVRRQAVQSLGGVPEEARLPVLERELRTLDPQILAATLSLLTRSKNPQVSTMILGLLDDPEVLKGSPDVQRMLFQALAEVAHDEAVPALEAMLLRGGLFARSSLARQSAAQTLRRIGTARAQSVLTAGARSWNGAVRRACIEASGLKEAA